MGRLDGPPHRDHFVNLGSFGIIQSLSESIYYRTVEVVLFIVLVRTSRAVQLYMYRTQSDHTAHTTRT